MYRLLFIDPNSAFCVLTYERIQVMDCVESPTSMPGEVYKYAKHKIEKTNWGSYPFPCN